MTVSPAKSPSSAASPSALGWSSVSSVMSVALRRSRSAGLSEMPRSPERPAVISSTTWLWVTSLAGDVGGHPAEVERGDPVGDLEHVGHVVRDEHDAEAVVGEPADQVEDLAGLGDAERRGRLVEQHDLGVPEHRLGDGHGLALATGQAGDRAGAPTSRCAPRARPGSRGPGVSMRGLVEHAALDLLAAEEHVLDDVEVVAQREVLVDDLDAEGRDVVGAVDRRPACPRRGSSPVSIG